MADLTTAAKANPGAFMNIQTYDALRSMNPVAASNAADPNCINANFADSADLSQGTIGTIVPGAVQDRTGRVNDYASEPLAGSVSTAVPGFTTGPDLKSVRKNIQGDVKKAIYVFDESVQNPIAARFGAYAADGTRIPATSVIVQAGTEVVATFGLADARLDSAVRFDVQEGAVEDRPQTVNLAGGSLSTPSASGARLAENQAEPAGRPQVTSASPVGPASFRVQFNEDVVRSSGTGTLFFAITDDGTGFQGTAPLDPGGDTKSVIVNFPPAAGFESSGIVKILVLPGAAPGSDGRANLASQAATATANSVPGFTNAPDLLGVRIDLSTNRVAFIYDEAVNPLVAPPQSGFRAVAADNSEINATSVPQVNNNVVVVGFPNSLRDAVAFSNPGNRFTDALLRPNPHQSTSKDIQVGPAPPPPPPPGAAPPPPPPVAPPNTNPGVKTTVTINRRGRRYFGTVKSTRKACRQGRRVILKRRGNQARFGSKFSSRTGRYSITRKRRLGGRVYVVVTARKTGSTNCRSGKSRTIRG